MKQKVIKIKNVISPHARGSKGSNYLTLACGHVKRQKGSISIPVFCNCTVCDDIASGKSVEYFESEVDAIRALK